MMIPNSIIQKFPQKMRSDFFSPILESDWNNSTWQINNSIRNKENLPHIFQNSLNHFEDSFFCTPYYLNLISESMTCPITKLILNQKVLHYHDDETMLLNDDEFVLAIEAKNKKTNGILEIHLPLLTICPQRITESLIKRLKTSDTVIVHTNIQHPSECTRELFYACSSLADAGFIINNRMTFLNGINDSEAVVKDLNLKLLMMRVRPYLIYIHEERSPQNEFLNVSKITGIQILDSLRGWTSGLAVPHLIFCDKDNNKNPILPNYIKENNDSITNNNLKENSY